MSPCARASCPRTPSTGWSPSIRCMSSSASAASWCSSRSSSAGEDIFSDYAYFSSYSDCWLEHCERYAEAMIARFGLDGRSLVVEVASNDGYLLQYFVARGIPVLGIEPAANVAAVAEERGVPTRDRVLRRGAGRAARGGGQAGRSAGRQQRARPRARPQRLRRRHEDPARSRRRAHPRVPASAAADRGEPVRHDLPRALLVFLVHHVERIFAHHGLRSSTSRSSRRTAVRCASSRCHAEERAAGERRVAALLRARARSWASTRSAYYRGFASR